MEEELYKETWPGVFSLLTLHSSHFTYLNYSYFTTHLPTPISLQTTHTFYRRPSTSTMSSEFMIRIRLTILFLTLLSLAVASLSSASARFAVILRDRARFDYINTTDGILDNNFQSLQSQILIDTVITAVATAAFTIYGAVITVHPRWLREHESILPGYAIFQMILAFIMIGTGGYLADHVHGFQTSFEKFGANDSIPYYGIMYYGGVAQAAYGSVLVFLAITVSVLVCVFDHYETKQNRVKAAASEAAAANNSGKEFSQV